MCMLEKSIPNLTQRLNKETVLVIPVEIDIYDVYVNMLTILSVSMIRKQSTISINSIIKIITVFP